LVETTADTYEESLNTLEDAEVARDHAVIVLSEQPKSGWLSRALRAGVRAVLPREITPEQLRAALEAASAGLLVIHPRTWKRAACCYHACGGW